MSRGGPIRRQAFAGFGAAFALIMMGTPALVRADPRPPPSEQAPNDALSPLKTQLEQARQDYRSAVAQNGRNSPQAQAAKTRLRDARRSFHEARRQNQPRQAPLSNHGS